jgi:hypothetical protein
VLTGTVNALSRLQCLLGAEPRRVADHHFSQADDSIERRAQLVADDSPTLQDQTPE